MVETARFVVDKPETYLIDQTPPPDFFQAFWSYVWSHPAEAPPLFKRVVECNWKSDDRFCKAASALTLCDGDIDHFNLVKAATLLPEAAVQIHLDLSGGTHETTKAVQDARAACLAAVANAAAKTSAPKELSEQLGSLPRYVVIPGVYGKLFALAFPAARLGEPTVENIVAAYRDFSQQKRRLSEGQVKQGFHLLNLKVIEAIPTLKGAKKLWDELGEIPVPTQPSHRVLYFILGMRCEEYFSSFEYLKSVDVEPHEEALREPLLRYLLVCCTKERNLLSPLDWAMKKGLVDAKGVRKIMTRLKKEGNLTMVSPLCGIAIKKEMFPLPTINGWLESCRSAIPPDDLQALALAIELVKTTGAKKLQDRWTAEYIVKAMQGEKSDHHSHARGLLIQRVPSVDEAVEKALPSTTPLTAAIYAGAIQKPELVQGPGNALARLVALESLWSSWVVDEEKTVFDLEGLEKTLESHLQLAEELLEEYAKNAALELRTLSLYFARFQARMGSCEAAKEAFVKIGQIPSPSPILICDLFYLMRDLAYKLAVDDEKALPDLFALIKPSGLYHECTDWLTDLFKRVFPKVDHTTAEKIFVVITRDSLVTADDAKSILKHWFSNIEKDLTLTLMVKYQRYLVSNR